MCTPYHNREFYETIRNHKNKRNRVDKIAIRTLIND